MGQALLLATATYPCATQGSVNVEKPTELRRTVTHDYVVDRLKREAETAGRGYQARVAKVADVTPTHVSNLMNGKATVGEDFEAGVARLWGITVLQLRELAKEWKSIQLDRPEDTSRGARLVRLIDAEVTRRGGATAAQVSRAASLLASDGEPSAQDVRGAFDRPDDPETVDAPLETEHHQARGKRKRKPK